jgi:hypothetical protein
VKPEKKRKVVGLLLIAFAVGGAGFMIWSKSGGGEVADVKPAPPAKIARMQPETAADGKAAVADEAVTVKGTLHPFRPNVREEGAKEEAKSKPQPEPKKSAAQAPAELPSLVHTFSPTVPLPEPDMSPPREFAPRGTLVQCQLVLTLDSSSLQTPVLGMVTKNVYHDGKLIIPAGTEVHGFARTGRTRDRIEANGTWTFVWEDGREFRIGGIALDREANPDGEGWGISDGSAGIRGKVTKADDYQELKLMLATFISGVAKSSKETSQTIFGSQPDNTMGNAALEGVSDVGQQYARMLLKQIEEEGYFVRVAAGTEFYIYLLGVFEPQLASVGGTSQGETPKQSWELSRERYEANRKEVEAAEARAARQKESPEDTRVREALEQRAKLMERIKEQFPMPPPPATESQSLEP